MAKHGQALMAKHGQGLIAKHGQGLMDRLSSPTASCSTGSRSPDAPCSSL
jgi:hypothetical protein